MFDAFYHVAENPFKICTDPRFLWCSERHSQILSNLIYCLMDRNGVVVLTGDIGTGKTTIVNALLNILGKDVYVARINHPGLSAIEFLRAVAKCLDPDFSGVDKSDLLLFFNAFSQKVHHEDKAALIIVDEAQHLSMELLEEVRLLSNMEQAGQRILSIMLVGQPELVPKIESPQNRSLHQRVTLFCEMQTLSATETPLYVDYRLKVSGSREQLFTSRAMLMIHTFSQGNPRLINILCERAMRIGGMKKHRKIDADVIIESARDMKLCNPVKMKAYELFVSCLFSWRHEQPIKLKKWMMAAGPVLQNAWIRLRQYGMGIFQQLRSTARALAPKLLDVYTRFTTAYRSNTHRSMWLTGIGIITIIAAINAYQATHGENYPDGAATGPDAPIKWTAPSRFDDTRHLSSRNASPDPTLAVNMSTSLPRRQSSNPVQEAAEAGSPPEIDNPGPTLQSDPGEPEKKLRRLAELALEQKNYKKAIDLLESVNRTGIGRNQIAAGLYSDALVGRALEIMAVSAPEAEAMLRKAIDAFPGNARAHVALGKYHTRTRAYAQAVADYQNAIALDPGMSDALFNLGYIYATTGRLVEAETAFRGAAQLKPPYLGKSLFNLAVVQHKLGKMELSLANLEKAVAMMPQNEKAVTYLNRLKHSAPGISGDGE